MFNCSNCGSKYMSFKALRQHALQKHPGEVENVAGRKEKRYKCSECDKQYNNKQSFSRHEKNEHNVSYVKWNQLYNCGNCDYKTCALSSINLHISSLHGIDVEPEIKNFENEEEFLKWKRNEEKNYKCKFIATGGKHKNQNVRSQTLICHRSQYYESKGEGYRSLKIQGSCKINAYCPARIKYTEKGGSFCVIYVKSHTHKLQLEHITLTSEERSDIAKQIACGVSFDRILDDIRESFYQGESLERKHLLTRKDLLNIEQSFNIRGHHQRHINDAISIESWIKEEIDNNCSPSVLFYKPQGQTCVEFPQLAIQDFALILMNQAQSEILMKYGTQTLCIDGTHGLNQYDFQLITLLIIDDYHQGFPCAFLISNRSDAVVSKILFLKIQERIGEFSVDNFMSDMDESFFNGFKSVMPMPKRRLYCSWHVDKAWRKNLSKIHSKENQAKVYKILRTLLEETDSHSFHSLFTEVKSHLLANKETEEFGKYFFQNYENNVESWAFCFRLHSQINTNMHLERMHRTLKEIYCNKKKIKRLDHNMLFILHKFVRDRLFDQLITNHKGKLTTKIKELRKRHKASLELDANLITEYDGGWICPSSKQTETYFVQRNKEGCQCHLKCNECNHCIHNFMCTCIDNAVQWNMCKHIHLLCRSKHLEKHGTTAEESNSIVCEDLGGHDIDEVILTDVGRQSAVSNLNKIRNDLLQSFNEMLNGADEEQLLYIKKQLKALNSTVDVLKNKNTFLKNNDEQREEKLKKEPPNKKMEQQRRLFSTKKKTLKKKGSLAKPLPVEKMKISLNMLLKPNE